MKIKYLIAVAVLLGSTAMFAQSGPEIVMDNADATFEGDWTASSYAGDRWGKDYRFSSTNPDRATARAIYRPKIPADGNYSIDIFFSQGSNRSKESKWTIVSEDGEELVIVDQQGNGGQWYRIAESKRFKAGTSGYVRLQNDAPGGHIVLADAVRFVPAGAVPGSGPVGSKGAPSAPVGGGGFVLDLSGVSGGAVTRSPEQPSYNPGTKVTLTAKAADGYVFGGWSGDASGFKNPITVIMNSTKSIAVNFISAGVGAILDDQDAEVKLEGTWYLPSQVWQGARYGNYQYAMAESGRSTATATFRPNLPRAGKYDVYVWHVEGNNRSTSAAWVVQHKSGQLKTNVNQRVSGGKWVALAKGLEFKAGNEGYARLSNNAADAGSGTVVIADAVAFVFTGQ